MAEKKETDVAFDVHNDEPDVDPKRTGSLVIRQAKAATDKEHSMTLIEGLRTYPKAIGWSVLISMCITMEAFDGCLLNTFYGMPQFTEAFGEQTADGGYEIPARWQSGLSNGTQCGQIIGLFINGWASERFGYRWTVIVCLAMITCWVSIMFTATSLNQLLVAYILSGIPWGVFQTLCITYASEVCPVALRGYLTTWVNFCWGLGQVIGVGAVRGCLDIEGRDAYRIPYSLQWMWPLPLALGIFLAPESPWWLVRKGRLDDAKKSLIRESPHNSESE